MARRKAEAPIDLAQSHALTAGLIAALRCPEGKGQAFLRDAVTKGLRVRVTAAGAKSFVFESKVNGKTLRQTIGNPGAWTIEAARAEANRIRVLVDQKTDPRELERQRAEAAELARAESRARAEAEAQAQFAQALTVGTAWARYLEERRPLWGERHFADHQAMASVGGTPLPRAAGKTSKPGPLAGLMQMRLRDLDGDAVEAWAKRESPARAARVRLALRILKAFLRWCAEDRELRTLAHRDAADVRKAREAVGRAQVRKDVLLKAQLPAWFEKVRALPNQVFAAYLQGLLLTGARREELAGLRWSDVNWQWKGITIRDKVEGERVIPLTPYLEHLLSALPRRNEWVFSSSRALSGDEVHVRRRARYHAAQGREAPQGAAVVTSASGRINDPNGVHRQACLAAGIEGLTLHGLRRSFKSLTEWQEVPVGVVAQIMGHKPSATAEKHYAVRPLDLLRVHHERIEAWMLEQAGVHFEAKAVPTPVLRAISAA